MKKIFSFFLLAVLIFIFSITAYATSSSEGNALYQGLVGALSVGFLLLLGLIGKFFVKIMQKPNEEAKKVEEQIIASKNNTSKPQKNDDENISCNSANQNTVNEVSCIPKNINYKNNFCRKCGEKLIDGSKFCHKCGTETIDLEAINNDMPEM